MNRFPLLSGLAVLGLSLPAQAQSVDGVLSMCRRDTKNAVRRLTANDAAGISTLQGVEQTCLQGPKAEQLKGASGYEDFLKEYEAARALLASKVQAAQAAQATAKQAAHDSAPGGDTLTVRARWKTMPERCAPPSWETIDGRTPRVKAAPVRTSARISGVEPSAPAGGVDPRIFEDAPHRPQTLSGDDWVARLACGHDVEGIDPYFSERDLLGAIDNGGSIATLAQSLGEGAGDARATLRHAALVHQCFAASGFDVKRDYLRYLWCTDAVGTPPSPEAVAQAADARFPEDGWERRNVRFLYTQGFAARQEVVAAFTQAEARYPEMKALFRDTIAQARVRHAERRTRHAELLQTLEPLSAAAQQGSLPEDCLETLRGLRARLAREVAPRDARGVSQLRARHPIGYQLSEALAACYVKRGQQAHALLELRGMGEGQSRSTVEEEIYFSLEDAVAAAKKKHPAEELEGRIPNLGLGAHHGVPFPLTLATVSRLWERVKEARVVGDDAGRPLDIAGLEPVAGGVKVSFKPVKYPWQAIQCVQTDRIERIDYSGYTAHVIYQQECKGVGPVETRTHQEPPLTVATAEAAAMKPGMRVLLLVSADGQDVAVERLGWPDKKDAVVVQGIALDAP